MPYIQIFFVTKLFSAVSNRKKYFKELLNEDIKNKTGIF